MLKSLQLQLDATFGTAVEAHHLTMKSLMVMKKGNNQHYKRAQSEAILQEFDGLLAFINLLDVKSADKCIIPFKIIKSDIHLIHLLKSSGSILIKDLQGNKTYTINPLRGRYIYLPAGLYELHIPKGQSHLSNLYFRCKIFRDGNERPFHFLHPLIEAHRSQSIYSCVSIDFEVGTRTRAHIKHLVSNLKKGKLENEEHIFTAVKELIRLSSEKIFNEYERVDGNEKTALALHDSIRTYCELEGHSFTLTKLAEDFGANFRNLNKIHFKYFNKTMQQYKNEVILKQATDLILAGNPSSNVSDTCNFKHRETFNHFFYRHTGMSPTEYFKTQGK